MIKVFLSLFKILNLLKYSKSHIFRGQVTFVSHVVTIIVHDGIGSWVVVLLTFQLVDSLFQILVLALKDPSLFLHGLGNL